MKKVISLLILLAITIGLLTGCGPKDPVDTQSSMEGSTTSTTESTQTESTETSETEEIPEPSESVEPTDAFEPPYFPGYEYDKTVNIEDNVFLDALTYTGYNMEKHRKDGLMWHYVLSADKRGKNWLSKITYGGGCSGLETKDGLPNIAAFEHGGLVCASFATYVYFNYLPNVANIDTSMLAKPEKSWLAPSFHEACEKWLAEGLTSNIAFTATNTPEAIVLKPEEEIPIGSIIVFRDMNVPDRKSADHITVYVGYKNGYHWVIQTGNRNGPEFCAVERFKFGPDPMWPLAIYTTPPFIYEAISEALSEIQ